MFTNQKGAVHLLLPVIILVVISLVALNKVQTTTKFPDSQVQGVIARSENSKAVLPANKVNPAVEKNKPNTTVEDKAKIEPTKSTTKIKNEKQEEKVINKKEIIDDELENEEEGDENEASESSEPTESEEINELRAISKFPLRIDTSTNQLIMTKNGVERVLTTLPAKAVQNMLRAHLKKGLGPKFFQASASASPIGTPSATPTGTPSASATPSASPTEEPIATESADITILENQISLEEENGQIVYKIPAKKKLKLFGIFPITTDLTGFVSAQTGVLIEEKQSLLSRILDLLSP